MRASPLYVYAVSVGPPPIQLTLDLMRIVANPETKRRAHVTVRGPYHVAISDHDRAHCDRVLAGAPATIDGAGSFFSEHQNTVYLSCSSEAVRKVWDKPGLVYTPHLTLYDGSDRTFAEILLKKLKARPFAVEGQLGRLEELVVGSSHQDDFREALRLGVELGVFGELPTPSALSKLDVEERVHLIERVARSLQES